MCIDAGSSRLNINLLLLGRPHLTRSIKAAAYNLPAQMATIHIEARKNRDDLSSFIRQGISRRLQIEGASDDLMQHIQTTIEQKAKGMFLWANLMLEILQCQTTEDDICDSLRTAPEGIDDMITETLKVYSSMFRGREAEEFNTILAWLSRAARPLTLAEIDAALRRLSPAASRVLSLEDRMRNTYATLLDTIRDDGLSTALLQSRQQSVPSRSIPETTTVAFAHASIAEYFQKGKGKFSKRKTVARVGVVRHEAELSVLRTCLEVFVRPGNGGWLESSKALQLYAKHNWFFHLREVQEIDQSTQPVQEFVLEKSASSDLMFLLHQFLNDEVTIRQWSCNTPWDFYDETKTGTISRFLQRLAGIQIQRFSSPLESWIEMCVKRPGTIFVPVAKVCAKEGLLGSWLPEPTMRTVAQIRAIAEGDDTLETLPDKPPFETIIKAAKWADLEANAVWNRKLAVCLRNCGHVERSIEYFERALELDYNLVEARSGLATAYREQGYFTKVIDLEIMNAGILQRRIADTHGAEEHIAIHQKQLCVSFQVVARTYQRLENTPMALRYWRKAAKTGHIQDWAISWYLTLLAETATEARWEETYRLFHNLHITENTDGQSRLTTYMHNNMWPERQSGSFFAMAATAAKETGSFSWLVEAYDAAIAAALEKSHMLILTLKLNLFKLYAEYIYDFSKAETLVEEIAEVASVSHAAPLHELEKCKEAVAKSFCRICIRRTLQSGQEDMEDYQLGRVVDLFESGIQPLGLAEKIIWGEDTHVFLALLQRLTGQIETATLTLRPYMAKCMEIMLEAPDQKEAAQWMLGSSLVAMGCHDDGIALLRDVHASHGWSCDGCLQEITGDCVADMCQYCLEIFCQDCMRSIQLPRLTRFCLQGHSPLSIDPTLIVQHDNQIQFRGTAMDIEECLSKITEDWGLNDSEGA